MLNKIENSREALLQSFSFEEINKVTSTWENFIDQMQANITGGVMIYAELLP